MSARDTRRAGVIGWPIKHSRSPLIHRHWLARHGVDGCYDRFAVSPEDITAFLSDLPASGLVGCNVTIPHKEAAYAAAHLHEASADAVGAANTLWLDGDRLVAANTDTYGFMRNLDAQAPGWNNRSGGAAVVLGAGGAARAIVHGLIEAGVSEVRIVNRTRAAAERLTGFFAGRGTRLSVHDWSDRQAASAGTSLVVNTTSLGMNGVGDPDIGFQRLGPDVVAADIVYVPLTTPFLAAASAVGCRTVDGLGMLLHQAVPGFERWFGVRPEVTAELRALIVADIEGR